MFNINLFTFKYQDQVLTFTLAKEAIEYFNKKGYGMQNWTIIVDYANNGNSNISLATFNHITDTEELIQSYKNRLSNQ